MEKSNESKKLIRNRVILSKLKRRFLKNIWVARAVILVVVVLVVLGSVSLVGRLLLGTPIGNGFGALRAFVGANEKNVKTSEGVTNVLLLGKSGEGHDSMDLTDTIMFVSISFRDNEMTLVSTPRDIWVEDLRAKLNSAYYWGNQKMDGGGLILAKSSVEEIVGKPVHYGVVVDFSIFREVVDELGGVDVEIERSFEDMRYPIAGRENDECGGDKQYGCRYETVKFSKGMETMNGDRALKFVRSRNADGEEGTDLARSARQQSVIKAIIQKGVSLETLLSPKRLMVLKGKVFGSVETDMGSREISTLARQLVRSRKNVKSYTLPKEFLKVPPKSFKYDNLYIFVPVNGDWSKVHGWVESILP